MAFRQDMPPSGGYAPIIWQRVPQKRILNGWVCLGLYALVTGVASFKFFEIKKYVKKLEVEKYDCYISMLPFIRAEQDRALLREMYRLREEEREMMKDHEGWTVGTLYGHPLMSTEPRDAFPPFNHYELYAHSPRRHMHEHYWPDLWI